MQPSIPDLSASRRTSSARLPSKRAILNSVCVHVQGTAHGIAGSGKGYRDGLGGPRALDTVPEFYDQLRYRFFKAGHAARSCLCVIYDNFDRMLASGDGRGRTEAWVAASEDLRRSRIRSVSLAAITPVPHAAMEGEVSAEQDDLFDFAPSPGSGVPACT